LAASAPPVYEVRTEERPEYVVHPRQPAQPTRWQSFQFGDDIEIKIRKQLTPAQRRQLALAGQLLQSMFGQDPLNR